MILLLHELVLLFIEANPTRTLHRILTSSRASWTWFSSFMTSGELTKFLLDMAMPLLLLDILFCWVWYFIVDVILILNANWISMNLAVSLKWVISLNTRFSSVAWSLVLWSTRIIIIGCLMPVGWGHVNLIVVISLLTSWINIAFARTHDALPLRVVDVIRIWGLKMILMLILDDSFFPKLRSTSKVHPLVYLTWSIELRSWWKLRCWFIFRKSRYIPFVVVDRFRRQTFEYSYIMFMRLNRMLGGFWVRWGLALFKHHFEIGIFGFVNHVSELLIWFVVLWEGGVRKDFSRLWFFICIGFFRSTD